MKIMMMSLIGPNEFELLLVIQVKTYDLDVKERSVIEDTYLGVPIYKSSWKPMNYLNVQ